jgi:hypothetical protein
LEIRHKVLSPTFASPGATTAEAALAEGAGDAAGAGALEGAAGSVRLPPHAAKRTTRTGMSRERMRLLVVRASRGIKRER